MDSKEIKSLLKDAREAVMNKDFQLALRLSKKILKEDAENYMGLIFLGLSLLEISPKEQAIIAFKKAIEIKPNNVLGWNGLASCYEKLGTIKSQQELIPIYTKLLQIDSNHQKFNEICEKIMSMQLQEENIVGLAQVLSKIASSSEFPKETCMIAQSTIACALSKLSNLPTTIIDIYTETLSHIVGDSKLVTKNYYNEYLKLLYKQNKYDELIEESTNMHKIYNMDTTSLEWICKVYNELIIEDSNKDVLQTNKIKEVCDTLFSIQNDSTMGLFTKAVLHYQDKNYFEALDLLNKVTTARPGLLHAWVLLSTSCIKLHMYSDAHTAAMKADKLLISINNTNTALRKKIDFLLFESLSYYEDEDNIYKAIELGQKLNTEDSKFLKILIRCYINLKDYNNAEKFISILKEKSEDKSTIILVTAWLLHKQGKLIPALELMENHNPQDLSEWWFEIALLNWDLKKFDKTLVPLLKAAKLDQNCFTYFLYLGHYYKIFNNYEKAIRCYEKTFKMNQQCTEAAVELTKLFRENKNWDANVSLLQSITGDVPDNNTEWAWIQLGLNYLAQEEYAFAIDALRYVLRVNPNNSHCWESLGDAYMGRGAYTSALKSYQKASEITPNLLYPLLQIANIRRTLGEYTEAKNNFEEILATNKSYVPALKGLAETCIHLARSSKKSYCFGAARDYAQNALDTLIVGIKQRNNLSCLWKLAGDSCLLVAGLPERYCCMLVLSAFAEGTCGEGNQILEKMELFTLAERLYHKAATLGQNALIWHDLAACFLSHAYSLNYSEQSVQLFSKAAAVVEHCIKLNPNSWQHWNLKGVIAATSGHKNYAVAQHCFIKAVKADNHSAVSWCNLGVLYLILNDLKLSNAAFGESQRADPNFVNSWMGQALIAETLLYNDDAMDLFRHSTQLSEHLESCIGYGHWVCKTLLGSPSDSTIYSIHNMYAIPVACDALTWYTDNNPDDACAWNILGILRERMCLNEGAAQAFKSALLMCSKEFRDKARINYARLLFKQQKYKQAIDMYKNVQEATFNSASGLALSLFKDHQYEESYEAYEQALNWLTEEQTLQSDLLVALASMSYMFQGPDTAKTLLFQSTSLKSPSPYGLYATLAVGLLHKDLVLPKLVLKELRTRQEEPQILPHYVKLFSYTCLLENDPKSAIRELSILIHKNPDNAFLWLSLAEILIRIFKQAPQFIPIAAIASKRAEKLGFQDDNAIKVCCIVSISFLLINNYQEALKMAQHAIHYYPHLADVWSIFIAALHGCALKTNNSKTRIVHLVKHVSENLKPSNALLRWLNNLNR